MGQLDKDKICRDTMKFIYKYTHESALRYPLPDDYIEMAEDMKFSEISLRIEFPVGEHPQGGKRIVRKIYGSGRPAGEELSFKYKVSLGGNVEVVYSLNKGVELDSEDMELYQWICDQIFLVYGKQQVVDALNLMSKVNVNRPAGSRPGTKPV
ncbi:MAG: hypothetical protein K6C35_01275 [Eubacterium sp.]|nr:hypothetical protein [Eubacterium sp.]SEF78354.1 hypothetical protein SAMN04487934_103128 [Eubacterium ruminantium]